MDPVAVLKLLWRYRFALLPVILVTLAAAVYVVQFAPRTYQSSMSTAIVNPNVPTEIDKEFDPSLAQLNSDNPYLRSSDPALIAQVMVARLNAATTVRELEAAGLSPEYVVAPGSTGSGFIVNITGVGPTAESSLATTRAVGGRLEEDLRQVQKVNGADDRYLFTPIVITTAMEATEQFSSRLRSLIVVFLGGGVLAFAAISLARGIESAKRRRQSSSERLNDMADVELPAEEKDPRVNMATVRGPGARVPGQALEESEASGQRAQREEPDQ